MGPPVHALWPLVAAACVAGAAMPRAEPAPDLDATWAFPARSVALPERAWLGGDSDWSIPLGNGSALWLFGDTFVGAWNASARQRVAGGIAMPHGTLGRVDGPGAPLVPFWNTSADGSAPEAWFLPRSGPAGDYLWTTAGVTSGNGLLLLAARIRTTGSGAFGFRVVATTVVRVADARPHPLEWSYDTCDMPGTGQDNENGTGTVLHSAAWRAGSGSRAAAGDAVTLLGERHAASAGVAVMVRVPSASLASCRWEGASAWTGAGGWAAAGPSPPPWASLAPVFGPAVSETTVTPMPACAGAGFFSAWVPFGSSRVRVRTAPSETGPWADAPSLAFDLPAPANDTSAYFSYAAKAHPELDGPGCSSALSVVTNAYAVSELMRPGGADAYVPRMWRIRWR